MPVTVEIVQKPRDLRRFVKFPFGLYKDCEYWVPPLIRDELHTLRSDQNPAFDHCRARYWLARKDGRLVGRIAGIINERLIEKWHQKVARFAWVDFIDDKEVSAGLFAAVEGWAKQEGMEGIVGPLGFTGLDAEGMLIEGFDELGTLMDVYNYPYYPRHLESLGYQKDKDWVEYEITTPPDIPEKAIRVGNLVLKRKGLELVQARKPADLLPYAGEVFDLLNEAYSNLYGYVPLTPRQVEAYIDEYFAYINPLFNKVIVDKDGRLAAFGLIFPSLSHALQKARGRLFPFGFLRFFRASRKPKQLNLALIAVRPENRGGGIPAILMTEITRAAIEHGVQSAETGRELEDNTPVRSLWKSYHARQHKRRRAYFKSLI